MYVQHGAELDKLKRLFEEGEGRSAEAERYDAEVAAVAGAVTIAVVAVGVATYVVAAVNVAAGLNLAVQISVTVNMAVTAGGGGGGGGGGCMGCHAIGPDGNLDISTAAVRVSQLTGNPEIYRRALRNQVKQEITACLYAARNQGLIRLPRKGRKEIIEVLAEMSYRMAGI
ncbi:hypothetical protein [Ectothiorhodospira sp. PHS-1]|uniref:hypothetical protein n=1 Tax=Ectothiorhodospira sp. PHS-1 TaxID=519989 RepID=UPI001145DE87|nr:hypothetical protein [Ectothiorhodospira sp. PHS-1]